MCENKERPLTKLGATGLDVTPLTSAEMDYLRPLAATGVDMAMLAYVIDDTRPELQQKLNALGISDIYSVDFALSQDIRWKILQFTRWSTGNGSHRIEGSKGPGGLSDNLRACMPFIKYVHTALLNLPICPLNMWVFPDVVGRVSSPPP